MKIRIKFSRKGPVKFLGHLDLMRYFQKAIRRAGIDIKYSEGFSPHQIMSFAAPIGVGIESEGEYFDIEVNSCADLEEAKKSLDDAMAEGIEVLDFFEISDNTKKAMSVVAAAEYEVYVKPADWKYDLKDTNTTMAIFKDEAGLKEAVHQYIDEADSINVIKKTKKSEKEIDLKKFIYSIDVLGADDGYDIPRISMMLAAGSIENIKPAAVISYLCEKLGVECDMNELQILRKDVFMLRDGLEEGSKPEDFINLCLTE